MDTRIDIMKTSYLFHHINDDSLKRLLTCHYIHTRELKKQEIVFHQNDEATHLYMLLEGDIHVYEDTMDGKRNLLTHIHKPGDLFGEAYLFLNQAYRFEAIAAQNSKLLVISKTFFFPSCNCGIDHNQITQNLLTILSQKAYHLTEKLSLVSTSSLRQKIIKFLLDDHVHASQFNRNELSQYLGVTRPSLSRELANMEQENLIQIERQSIQIIDIEKLKSFL